MKIQTMNYLLSAAVFATVLCYALIEESTCESVNQVANADKDANENTETFSVADDNIHINGNADITIVQFHETSYVEVGVDSVAPSEGYDYGAGTGK